MMSRPDADARSAIPLLAVPHRFYTRRFDTVSAGRKGFMKDKTSSTSRPKTLDAGLLVLRMGAAFSLFALFGLPKVKAAIALSIHHEPWPFIEFLRQLGFPLPSVAAFVQTINESLGAVFVLVGFFGRIAATFLAVGFAVATYCSARIHQPSVFMAACYCLMFTVLALTGPGRISIDDMRSEMLGESTKA